MQLTHTINIDIDGKKVQLEVRDLTKKEAKDLQKKNDKIKKIVEEINSIQKQSKRLESKLERINDRIKIEMDSGKKLKLMDDRDSLYNDIEKLEDKATSIDIKNIDESVEVLFKERMELSCSGEGLEDVMEVAESYGYKRMWEAIVEALGEAEKKQ